MLSNIQLVFLTLAVLSTSAFVVDATDLDTVVPESVVDLELTAVDTAVAADAQSGLLKKAKKAPCPKGCRRSIVRACKKGKKAFRTTKTSNKKCSYRSGLSCKCQKLRRPKLFKISKGQYVMSRCNAKLGCKLVSRKFCTFDIEVKNNKKGKKVLRRKPNNKGCRFSRRTVCRCPRKSGARVISWRKAK
jgi:hypothetical protein